MIAAVYARKSTDQGSVADEAKSVTRQVDHAQQYAVRKGWTVDPASVFVDDGISGAEFANRPGFMQLMAAVKPRPVFQVLIMSETSRLGREAWETGYALKQLLSAGVRVFFYLEDRECSFDHPMDKLQFSMVQAFDEMERARASQRSTDTAIRKARAGHVTGGRVFGYENVEVVDAAGRRSHVDRRINEHEAAAVRLVFELAATGMGQLRIARELNDRAVRAPRAQQARPAAWAQSSVRAVLFRELYRGEIVWNRTKKRDRWGQARQIGRPESDWLRVPAPNLRIVPEELWEGAHAKITLARAAYRDATKGLRGGRPRIESKYLLPGLARCAICNGGLFVSSGNHGSGQRRRRVLSYGCTTHHLKGRTVCANSLRAPVEAIDAAVLGAIDEILTPDLIVDVLKRVRELREPTANAAEIHRGKVARELAEAEARVEKFAEAIGLTGNVPAVARRLQEADERRQALATALQAIGERLPPTLTDWSRVEADARRLLGSWRELLTRQVAQGRQLLRILLPEPIRFTPFNEAGRRGYRFAGIAAVGGLFGSLAEAQWRMASPPGLNSQLSHVPFVGEHELRRSA